MRQIHAPGTETCGCCTGTTTSTPKAIGNRPGLDQVTYRSGAHGDFLASMLAALTDDDRPALARLRTRRSDDPTIALLDAFAVACDVLTFYSERLANESYLRTALERTSLQELGRLVAYRLAPGAAAETYLAFALERPVEIPAAVSTDPGLLPPAVPQAVTLPERLRVQSVPGPDEKPQTFETVEQIDARPEWSSMKVVATTAHLPVWGRVDGWFAGSGLNLKAGDAVLFASRADGAADDLESDRWDVRLLTEVENDLDADTTHVRWEWMLGSIIPAKDPAAEAEAFVLRKRVSVFGHSAPQWKAMSKDFKEAYSGETGTDVPGQWPGFEALDVIDSETAEIDLEGSHPDIVRGSWVVVSEEGEDFYRELFEVTQRAEFSRSDFSVSGKVTRLTLKGETGSHTFGTPREVTVMAVAEPLTITEKPDTSHLTGASIVVEGDASTMLPERRLVLAGKSPGGGQQSEVTTVRRVDAVTTVVGGKQTTRTTIELSASLENTYQRSGAVVFGNVAKATHGETVEEILGNGDARATHASYTLKQAPLTHVPDDNPMGVESTLDVSVDGLEWDQRSSMYAAAAQERAYTTRDEPDGSVSVVFGDGIRGRRLPTGANNVRARYRKGLGSAGNLHRDQLSQAMDRPLGFKGVTNPLPAGGGVDPETEQTARSSIPWPIRTLERAVSLQDYADFAMAFPGIEKAVAGVLPLRAGRSIVVTVAGDDGTPPSATTVDNLATALRRHGDPLVRVEVVPVRTATVEMALRVLVDERRDAEAVLDAVEAALRARWDFEHHAIGQAVFASEVIAVAAGVTGVIAVDLDALHRSGATVKLNQRLVPAPASVTSTGEAVAAELIALNSAPLAKLEEMS